jgi:hypothetical protein
MRRTFPLAKMSGAIKVMTWVLFPLPVIMAVFAVLSPVALFPAALVAVGWLSVYLYFRPGRFVVSPEGLELVWPIRRRSIPRAELESAELVTMNEVSRDRGFLMRVGAGGLWGGFGMLWSSEGKHLDFYISRMDGLVLVTRRHDRPLLLTPDDPAGFVEAIKASADSTVSRR